MTIRIRGILRERRGIALASVMIIFIVSAILVTGISSAVMAQAYIIRSREKASQAHYYAYSAAETIKKAMQSSPDAVPTVEGVPVNVSLSGLIPSGEDASIVSATVTKLWENDDEARCILSVTAEDGEQRSTVEATVSFAKLEEVGGIVSNQLFYNNNMNLGNNTYITIDGETYTSTTIDEINLDENHYYSDLPVLFYNLGDIPTYTPPSDYDYIISSNNMEFYPWNNKTVKYTSNKKISFWGGEGQTINKSELVFLNTTNVVFNNANLNESVIYAPLSKDMSLNNANINDSKIFMLGQNGTLNFSASTAGIKNTVIYTNAKTINIVTSPSDFENVSLYAPNATTIKFSTHMNLNNCMFYLPSVENFNINTTGEFNNNTRIYAPNATIATGQVRNMDGVFHFKNVLYQQYFTLTGILYVEDTLSTTSLWGGGDTSIINFNGAVIAREIYLTAYGVNYKFGPYDADLIRSYLYPYTEFSSGGSAGGGGDGGTRYEFISMTYTKAS